MLSPQQHANAQLLALHHIETLLSPYKNFKNVTDAKIFLTLTRLQNNNPPMKWEIGNENDRGIIGNSLREKLKKIRDTEGSSSYIAEMYAAVHRSLILLSQFWPITDLEEDEKSKQLVPVSMICLQNLVGTRVADSEGYLYATEDIPQLLIINHPITRNPFHNRDVDIMRAMADENFFSQTKRLTVYAIKGDQGWYKLWFLMLTITFGIIGNDPNIGLFIMSLYITPDSLLLLAIIVSSAIIAYITSVIVAALVGLLFDISAYFSKHTVDTQQTINLLDEIEKQAKLEANNNPFYNQPEQTKDLEAAVSPAQASEVRIEVTETPPSAGRGQANYSPRFEFAGRPSVHTDEASQSCVLK